MRPQPAGWSGRCWVLALLVCWQTAQAAPGVDASGAGLAKEGLARLQTFMSERIAQQDVEAAVIGVVRRGRLGFLSAFGYQDAAHQQPLSVDAVFDLSWLTQPITAAAAVQLQAQGRWLLGDSIGRHLDRFRTDSPVTLFDLARQTSGLAVRIHPPSYSASERDAGQAGNVTESAQAAMAYTGAGFLTQIAAQPVRLSPGLEARSDFSLDVLGLAIESVTGQTLGAVFLRELLIPMDMWDTGFNPSAQRHARVTWREPPAGDAGRWPTRDPRRAVSFECGSACLTGTAPDYLRFVTMLLGGGELDGRRILSRASVALMTSNQLGDSSINRIGSLTDPAGARMNRSGYGLGLLVRGADTVSSLPGSMNQFGVMTPGGSFFWADPAEQIGVVMLALLPGTGAAGGITAAPGRWPAHRLQAMVRVLAAQAIAD